MIGALIKCFNPTNLYDSLEKKDDDLGIQQAQCWIEQNPLNVNFQKLNYQQINQLAHKTIKQLKKVPINSNNLESINTHLIALAKQNDIYKQGLLKNVRDLRTKHRLYLSDNLTFQAFPESPK